jgi:hypothetical protein
MTRIRDQHIRGSIAFGAACDAALSVVLSARVPEVGVPPPIDRLLITVSLAGVAAVGLIAYGAALNDLFDRRRDAVVGGRPIGSADRATGPNVIIVVGSLLLALFAAAAIGRDSTYVTLVLATLLLFHNAVARFIPAIGLVVPGAVLAGLMLIPDWRMPMPIAVWLAMTIAVMAAVGVHVLADKRPRISRRAGAVVVLGWAIMSCVVLGLRTGLGSPFWPDALSPVVLVWPLVVLVGLGLVARWKIRTASSPRHAGAKVIRYVALWQPLLAAAWCAGLGDWVATGIFAACGIIGLLAVGGYRELAGMSGPPAQWR